MIYVIQSILIKRGTKKAEEEGKAKGDCLTRMQLVEVVM